MPPKSARPPKKGGKKDIEQKEKAAVKAQEIADLPTVFDGLAVEKVEVDDGGRVATGMLESEPRARDIKIGAFSLALYGAPLVEDTTIELNQGARYGLLGRNGCGKSTFLKCLAAHPQEVPIPDVRAFGGLRVGV
ncbi:hypothetical protein B484DRAFT_186152 [Ochromonadaceae sp. CCMP2298]|nr:hypothetical protein B484DRAFT_186152 [Ochromonadaceae sp. CCMP2298]